MTDFDVQAVVRLAVMPAATRLYWFVYRWTNRLKRAPITPMHVYIGLIWATTMGVLLANVVGWLLRNVIGWVWFV